MTTNSTEIVVRGETNSLTDQSPTSFALTIREMKERKQLLYQFLAEVMEKKVDYDTLPGTPKPTLLQPGAQALDIYFGFRPAFEILPNSIVDWERGLFAYEVRCTLIHRASGQTIADGLGSCNSLESKYRLRDARRKCPKCGAEAIARSKQSNGWYCHGRNGGCWATFANDDERIVNQPLGQVANDKIYDVANTLLKMACKRAHIAATLNATGASRIFTQDIEDLVANGVIDATTTEESAEPPAVPKARPAPTPAPTRPNPPAPRPPATIASPAIVTPAAAAPVAATTESPPVLAPPAARPERSREDLLAGIARLQERAQKLQIEIPALAEAATADQIKAFGLAWQNRLLDAEKKPLLAEAISEWSIAAAEAHEIDVPYEELPTEAGVATISAATKRIREQIVGELERLEKAAAEVPA